MGKQLRKAKHDGEMPHRRHTTKCQSCGALFISKPSSKRKFCSMDCSRKAHAATRAERKCEMCGEMFIGEGRRANNRYCSRACSDQRDKVASLRGQERVTHISKPCLVCGIEVRRRKGEIRQYVFCSRECYGKGRSMHLTGQQGFEVELAGRTYWANHTTKGYVTVYVAELRKNVAFHRLVMADVIGRPLHDHENVHHKNGDRSDNSPANLELWSSSQPSGQNVEDKIEWAKALIAEYEQPVRKLRKARRANDAASATNR